MGNFTFIDLFAGIGGFRLAAESLGGECIGFSEINKDAIGTYCANFNETEWQNFGDIRKIKNLPAHDLLTAGVPCQSWSIAGKNLGFDDERGLLWNDTIWLLRHSRPKAFVFENVKGLADPRNSKALEYIMEQVNLAGYYAKPYLINAYDYGMLQHRIRLYIIGFAEKRFFDRFNVPQKMRHGKTIADIIGNASMERQTDICNSGTPRWSLSCNSKGQNDYFLFNDIRNGHSTIHSWDIQDTTQRQKEICLLLLRNRRKKMYGRLDGNPLSLDQLQSIDPSVTQEEIDELVNIGILKPENYLFKKCGAVCVDMSEAERAIIGLSVDDFLNIDDVKNNRDVKTMKINAKAALQDLCDKGILKCVETRYDFKNTKISTGLHGVSRIFLPSSKTYPTLVASDTNDFITPVNIDANSEKEFKERFITEIYNTGKYGRINKREACRIQGFPENYLLPENRTRWMKLIGNSVAVPVISKIVNAIMETGVFCECNNRIRKPNNKRLSFPSINGVERV